MDTQLIIILLTKIIKQLLMHTERFIKRQYHLLECMMLIGI